MLSLCFRQLHSSLGEQDDVLHCQRVRSCYLDSALIFLGGHRQLLDLFLVSNNCAVFIDTVLQYHCLSLSLD